MQSLRLKTDTRYQTMENYRDSGGMHSSSSHFQKMMRRNRRMHGLPEEEPVLDKDSDHKAVSEWDREFKESTVAMQRQMREPPSTIQDRVAWQEGFDKNVRRLLQDFDFNDSPGCRLNHLERMHYWFNTHGAKTARKAKLGPRYITVDRNAAPVPGSARHLSSPVGAASLSPSPRPLDSKSTRF